MNYIYLIYKSFFCPASVLLGLDRTHSQAWIRFSLIHWLSKQCFSTLFFVCHWVLAQIIFSPTVMVVNFWSLNLGSCMISNRSCIFCISCFIIVYIYKISYAWLSLGALDFWGVFDKKDWFLLLYQLTQYDLL